jgi:hypothetical protein
MDTRKEPSRAGAAATTVTTPAATLANAPDTNVHTDTSHSNSHRTSTAFPNPVADCDEGELLQVSQFLTAFGTFYGCSLPEDEAEEASESHAPTTIATDNENDNENDIEKINLPRTDPLQHKPVSPSQQQPQQQRTQLVGPITPQDIRDCLDYRWKLWRVRDLQDAVHVWQQQQPQGTASNNNRAAAGAPPDTSGKDGTSGGDPACPHLAELQQLQASLDPPTVTVTDPTAEEEKSDSPDTPTATAPVDPDSKQQQQQSRRRRVQQLCTLWDRFTVWTTKALAQHVLLSHHHHKTALTAHAKDKDGSQVTCWSMLLNMPTALYVSVNLVPPDTSSNNDDDDDNSHASGTGEAGEARTTAEGTGTTTTTTATEPELPTEQQHDTAWSKLWDKVYGNHSKLRVFSSTQPQPEPHACSLALPPCHDTWTEYSRCSYMVALLPDDTARRAAHSSPLAGTMLREKQASTKFIVTPPDLVALWVRAQRNTQAARHLTQLFEIVPAGGTGATTDPNHPHPTHPEAIPVLMDEDSDDNNDNDSPPRYTAIYRGNHRLTYKKVVHESPLVDALIEWAVINQVLFTQHWVRNALKQPPWLRRRKRNARDHQSIRSANGNGNDNSKGNGYIDGNGRALKKRKVTPLNENDALDEWSQTELIRACQKYLLRWWARRNRPTAEILFYRNAAAVAAAVKAGVPVLGRTAQLGRCQIMDLISVNLNRSIPDRKFTDRTFVRIDRRIALGKYDVENNSTDGEDKSNSNDPSAHEDPRDCPFYQTVHRLLVALRDSIGDLSMDTAPFQAAVEDFDDFYLVRFYTLKNEAGMVAAARSLLDSSCADVVVPRELARLLSSLPPPWIDLCAICDKTVLEEDVSAAGFKSCSCCDTVVHTSCVAGDGIKAGSHRAKSFVKSCKPLREMYSIQVPKDMPPPDYRSGGASSELSWTMKVIDVNRRRGKDGKLEKYGIEFRHTEDTAELLDQLLSGGKLISQLPNDAEYPLGVKQTGLLVVDNNAVDDNSCGRLAGILPGDVMVAMQFIEFDTSDDNVKPVKKQSNSLPSMSKSDRFALFQHAATKVRIVVNRPSKNIIQESVAWRDSLCSLNDALKVSLDENQSLWFCTDCRAANPEKQIEEGKGRAYREAKFCRAVVRRLGMESHGLAFLDEDHVSSDGHHESLSTNISLRRLDCMMDWIISQNSDENVDSHSEAAFFVSGKRLDWAPKELEARPFELVCRGMSRLSRVYSLAVQSERTVNLAASDEHRALISHFLRIFCSWCLAADLKPSLSPGPGLHAVYARDPNLKPSCESCLVRSHPEAHASRICDSCLTLDLSSSSDPKISDVLDSYERCAALVGATVLLLPGNPILERTIAVLGKAGVKIDHLERPVELLVVSYLPTSVERQDESKATASDGMYHLLPVANQQQLQFLLAKCQVRQSLSPLSDESLRSWRLDGLLNLEGVVELSSSELRSQMQQTAEIRDAVTAEVARQAQCTCDDSHRPKRDSEEQGNDEGSKGGCCTNAECRLVSSQAKRLSRTEAAPTCKDELRRGSALIDALAVSGSPFFSQMLWASGVSFGPEQYYPNLVGTEQSDENNYSRHAEMLSDTAAAGPANPAQTQTKHDTRESSRAESQPMGWSESTFGGPAASSHMSSSGQASSSGYPLGRLSDMPQLSQTGRAVLPSLLSQRQTMNSRFAFGAQMSSTGQASSSGYPLDGMSNLPQHSQTAPAAPASFQITQTNGSRFTAASGTASSSTLMDSYGRVSVSKYANRPHVEHISQPRVYTAAELPVIKELSRFPFGLQPLREHDLHMPGILGTVLTRAETSLLLEAIKKGYPMLGLRFLCPRYSMRTLLPQLRVLCQPDVISIPRLPISLWDLMIRADYQRQLREPRNGEKRFRDTASYQMPTERFPVDSFCEQILCSAPSRDADYAGEARTLPETVDLYQFDTSMPQEEDSNPAPGRAMTRSVRAPVDYSRVARGSGNDGLPERIRGGGGNSSPAQELPISKPNSRCLADLPKSKWNKAYVYSFCETSLENMLHGQARFIGQVLPPSKEYADDDEGEPVIGVKVRLFYLSNVGLFADPVDGTYDPQALYVVVQDADDSAIISRYEKQEQEKQKRRSQLTSLRDLDAGIQGNGVPTYDPGPPGETDKSTNKTTTPEEMNIAEDPLSSATRLCTEQRGTTARLGVLPDGRRLTWFQSDPKAVYVTYDSRSDSRKNQDIIKQAQNHAQARYLNDVESARRQLSSPALRPCERGTLCCIWGCSVEVPGERDYRKCLTFSSPSELAEHLNSWHLFASDSSHPRTIKLRKGGLDRIAEGEPLRHLCSCITSAACARDPTLLSLSTKLGASSVKTVSGREFSLSPVEQLLLFQEHATLVPEKNRSDDVNELIGIFTSIARLFDLEGKCCFRLSDHDFAKASALDLDLHTVGSQDLSVHVEHENNPDCSVCALGAENVLLRQDDDVKGATSLYRGIGCGLMSDICFGIKRKYTNDRTREHVGRVKQMLLSMADKIPAALHLSDTARSAPSTTWIRAYLGQPLWSNMDVWRSFVLESRSLSSLSQALLVLVSGVDRERLPLWWRSEGAGWGKPQMLLTRPSQSNILLLIRVFDLAVAEFAASETIRPPGTKTDGGTSYLPTEFTKLPFLERTAQTLKWAEELGIDRWQGEYEMYCSNCQDGGDLLCCELCSNVAHAACLQPPLVQIPDYFVCEPCMTDIHALHSARQLAVK